jgi:hypothetical protein
MDEIISDAMVRALRKRRPLFGRRYVRLPAESVPLGRKIWHHRIALEGGEWGYTLRQARQMRKALHPLLDGYMHQLKAVIERIRSEIR